MIVFSKIRKYGRYRLQFGRESKVYFPVLCTHEERSTADLAVERHNVMSKHNLYVHK